VGSETGRSFVNTKVLPLSMLIYDERATVEPAPLFHYYPFFTEIAYPDRMLHKGTGLQEAIPPLWFIVQECYFISGII
jgi:hypothetical protein